MPSARPLSRDTHPEAEEVQLGIYRRLLAWQKLALVEGANHATRVLAISGLRTRHPDASDAEIQRRLMDLLLGAEAASLAYGPLTASDDEASDGEP